MLDVFFTIDVEIWCDGWINIDEKFPAAFDRYINGHTANGDFGLHYQLQVLSEYGLVSTCFVEPLFSARFGQAPLEDIVGLIQDAGHEVQLHLHTEWVDEARPPLPINSERKRQHMLHYSLEEQNSLIGIGKALLKKAGSREITAFRAGSFGFNRDTLKALAANNIIFDSSYNATMFGPQSGISENALATQPFVCEGIVEYPMAVFNDGLGKLRHLQLTACSSAEMQSVLWQAHKTGCQSIVILSHNFELMNARQNRADKVVINRLKDLCRFLDQHRDIFNCRGFLDLPRTTITSQPAISKAPVFSTGKRLFEQALRRVYQ
ncbi:MAG: polysaccharide deacetylase family protein [Parahaliea sp.]